MKVAVIGGGFTGLAAAEYLVSRGVEVEVWEAEDKLGGLAGGFKVEGWEWELEKFYHHIFANDKKIIELAEQVGWEAFFERPKTNVWKNGKEEQLDSPISLLRYSGLGMGEKIRMGAGLAGLKLIQSKQWGQSLEKYKVDEWLPRLIGKEGYEEVWEPLLRAKFGRYAEEVNMAWFWARVVKRTSKLGYFKGGFGKLAEKIKEKIEKEGGRIKTGIKVEKIRKEKGGFAVNGKRFDQVLMSVPSGLVNKLLGKKVVEVPKIDYLWGQTLVLELNKSLIDSYWLNILESEWPFLVAVEHTRFIEREKYGGKRVVYLGNYLAEGDKRLKMDKEELLEMFWPYLKKLNGRLRKEWVEKKWKFQSPFAQAVFPVNYSEEIPEIRTEVEGLYMANMSQVYPWDRGTNFAVEIGQEAAKLMWEDMR